MTQTTTFAPLFEPLPVVARTAANRMVHAPMSVCYGDEPDAIGLARPLFTDPDWAAKVADGRLDAIRTGPCDPPTCLRTQLDGAVCSHWPPAAVDRGYLGYDD